jgi:EF hand
VLVEEMTMSRNKWIWVAALSLLSQAAGVYRARAEPGGPERFVTLDTNGDGTVTTAEFVTGALKRWAQSDTDGNGKVSEGELAAQFAAHAQERFLRMDENGDGVIQRSEASRMPDARFGELDTDASGTLSQAELASGHPKAGTLGGGMHGLRGDTDNDGAITQAEASADAQQRAQRLDADGDGKITLEEFARAHGPHRGSPDVP